MARKCTLASSALALCIFICLVDDSPEALSGGVRMDFSPIYMKDQDITKVFRSSPYWWLFGVYIPNPTITQNKRECVHFKMQGQNNTHINLTAIGGRGSNQTEIRIYGEFYQCNDTYEMEKGQRKHPNCVRLTPKDDMFGANFRLLYLEYGKSSLFRVMDVGAGTGCVVLLSNSTVGKGLTPVCKIAYKRFCGEERALEKVYAAGCKWQDAQEYPTENTKAR
ncbi:uncharacterized protein LOC142578047 [Dermacentor variabilis]|uniref:uncharacterized protein LOC142578047 n=1 Tax=Dermacentor variabilis TaxID=34621 RepID=UPI003F5ADDEA